MSQQDIFNAQQIINGLALYEQQVRTLVGISDPAYRDTLVKQFVESLRRIRYVTLFTLRQVSNDRADPLSDLFDPERAAVLHLRQGNLDEAFWMIFLSVHFGKPKRSGWRLVRDIYGRLGNGQRWDWAQTSATPGAFKQWLSTNLTTLNGGDGITRRFGNHRKYETLHPYSAPGTGTVIETYINWVSQFGTHSMLIQNAAANTDGSPRAMFDYLYRSMGAVARFGRTGKFDYLTMVGKLGLAPIEPGSAYLQGATGPYTGAKLLFGNTASAQLTRPQLDAWLIQLESYLQVGMQPMEDALCNWQKSPSVFIPFRG